MRSGTLENDPSIVGIGFVDQYPIRFDVAIATSHVVAK